MERAKLGSSRMDPALPEPRHRRDRAIIAGIEKSGWYCARVSPGPAPEGQRPLEGDGQNDPAFTYTVGPSVVNGEPELILVGDWKEPCEILHAVLASVFNQGTIPQPGDTSEQIFQEFSVKFGAVSEERRLALLTAADYFNEGRPFRTLQVIVPDSEHRFPDHPEYAGYPQPLLHD